eukprot:1450321-Karenia_brevis.AAC.1
MTALLLLLLSRSSSPCPGVEEILLGLTRAPQGNKAHLVSVPICNGPRAPHAGSGGSAGAE